MCLGRRTRPPRGLLSPCPGAAYCLLLVGVTISRGARMSNGDNARRITLHAGKGHDSQGCDCSNARQRLNPRSQRREDKLRKTIGKVRDTRQFQGTPRPRHPAKSRNSVHMALGVDWFAGLPDGTTRMTTETRTPAMRHYDWDTEKEKMAHDLQEWTNYKERLLESGYGNNVSGLKTWHTLGIGLCSRAVKGACSVEILTTQGQSFDGWIIVRSLWETALDVAYFAVQPTHAQRDALADRYVSFDNISRLHFAIENGLTPKPEWVTEGATWDSRFGGSRKKWHGKNTTTDLIRDVESTLALETPDRMGPSVDMARIVARYAQLHWKSTSDYVHGSPTAVSRLWKSAANPDGWTDSADSCDPAWCLHDARYAMICTCQLYAVSSPVLAGVTPPAFKFD